MKGVSENVSTVNFSFLFPTNSFSVLSSPIYAEKEDQLVAIGLRQDIKIHLLGRLVIRPNVSFGFQSNRQVL